MTCAEWSWKWVWCWGRERGTQFGWRVWGFNCGLIGQTERVDLEPDFGFQMLQQKATAYAPHLCQLLFQQIRVDSAGVRPEISTLQVYFTINMPIYMQEYIQIQEGLK